MTAETRWLYVDLTHEEALQRGREYAQLCEEISDAEAFEEREHKRRRARLKPLKARERSLRKVLLTGREERHVEVRGEIDAERGRVNTVRVDTGCVVGVRPLLPEEREIPFFLRPTRGAGG